MHYYGRWMSVLFSVKMHVNHILDKVKSNLRHMKVGTKSKDINYSTTRIIKKYTTHLEKPSSLVEGPQVCNAGEI